MTGFLNALAQGRAIHDDRMIRQNALQMKQREATRYSASQIAQAVMGSENPAQAYTKGLQLLQAQGEDVSRLPQQWGEQAELLTRIYAAPEGERTEFERLAQGLSPEDAQQALRVKFGLAPKAENAKPTALQQRAIDAGMTPGSQEYQDFMRNGGRGAGVSLTTPDGTTLQVGGAMAGGQDSAVRQREREKALGKQDAEMMERKRKVENGLSGLQRRDELLLDTIRQARDEIERSSFNTGLAGQALRGLGGSAALNLDKLMDTVRANLGFKELQTMRDNSPTGGALGNVTERELQLLQSVQGSLDTARSEADLLQTLDQIEQSIQASGRERMQAFERDFGGGEEAPRFDLQSMSDDDILRALGQ